MNYGWQIGVIGSAIVHAAVLFGFHVSLSHPTPIVPESSVDVMLVAALPAPAPVEVLPESVVPAAPAPVEPTPPPLVEPEPEVKAPEPVVVKPESVPPPKPVKRPTPKPVAKAPEPVAVGSAPVITPAPVAQEPPKVVGDGSALIPGRDATPNKPEAGVRAEPNYLKNPEPEYPLAARRRRQQGQVLLNVHVSAQGRATEVTVKKSSGFAALDEAAVGAVRGWEFHPARIDSRAVESDIEVPVRFKLSN